MNLINYDIVEKSKEEEEIDKILSKKIMIHLQDFFKKAVKYSNKNTNREYKKKNKTKKNH